MAANNTTPADKPAQQAPSNDISSPIQRALSSGVLTQSPIITLVVGDSKIEYKVYQVLLCNESEFFRGCLQTQFSEASTAVVPVPEDDTHTVETFLQWLYSGCYEVRKRGYREVPDYAFGDKYCSDSYCNTTVDATRALCKADGLHFSLRRVQLAYDAGL